MRALLEWIAELPNWLKFFPFLVLLGMNAVVYCAGYVNLWLVVACVLTLCVAMATAGKKSDYHF